MFSAKNKTRVIFFLIFRIIHSRPALPQGKVRCSEKVWQTLAVATIPIPVRIHFVATFDTVAALMVAVVYSDGGGNGTVATSLPLHTKLVFSSYSIHTCLYSSLLSTIWIPIFCQGYFFSDVDNVVADCCFCASCCTWDASETCLS